MKRIHKEECKKIRNFSFTPILILAFIMLLNVEVYGSSKTLEIDDMMSIEIIDNRMNTADASRLFKYATEYLYNTKGDYSKAYNTLEKIRKYYGKELDDNCILWQAKCNLKMSEHYNSILDLLYQIEIIYSDGDVYNSNELKDAIKGILRETISEWSVGYALKPSIFYYGYLKKLKCNQEELTEIRQLITNSLLKKTENYAAYYEGWIKADPYGNIPPKNFFVSEGILVQAIKKDVFQLDEHLGKISGFVEKNFYLNFANYIYDHNLFEFSYQGRDMKQTESGYFLVAFYKFSLKPLNLFDILININEIPPILKEIIANE